MPIGLSKDALDLLYYLYAHRCLSLHNSKSVKAIERDLGEKIDVDPALRELLNLGLLGSKKKKETNYWADAGEAIRILKEHGYPVGSGGRRLLQ